ncbi:MAG: hypothetical protein Alpg2KO_00680 [Alphaproteobacteria bacterium]
MLSAKFNWMRTALLCSVTVVTACSNTSQTVIQDGDSIILSGGETVRLMGIDTPEHRDRHEHPPRWGEQPGALEASRALRDLVLDRSVRCEGDTHGYYGRRLVTCYVGDLNLNEEMVRLGWAWSAKRSGPYRELEREACRKRLGIWASDSLPMHPQRWRSNNPLKRPKWPCKR